MKKLYIALAFLLIGILILSACGGDETTTTTSTTSSTATTTTTTTSTSTATPSGTTTITTSVTDADAEKYGGTLKIIYPYSPASTPGWPGDTTNPQKLWTCWLTFEALVKLDANGEPHPWLATDWTWGPDNMYIDFTLRDDVTFHDGTDFTADSVVAHFEQLFADLDSAMINFDGMEKTGDYSVRLYLTVYMRNFWNNLAAWSVFFTSDTQLKEQGLEYVKEHPIGTGPYLYESFEKDVDLKFVRNDNYWQPGKPYLDKIEFYTTKEALTQQAKMETGEGDVLVLQTGKILKDMQDLGFTVLTETGSSNFIMFDSANEGSLTNDAKVRQAIEYGLNKGEIAEALGYGFMTPANQIPMPQNPAYNPNLPSREFNPDKARELLAEAGYPDGLKLKLISEVSGQDFAIFFQQYMADIGIEIELELIDNAKLWNYLFTGWEGMVSASFAMGTNFPNFVRTYFPPLATFNQSVKLPDEIIEKANAAMVETDDGTFRQMSDELIQWVWDEAYWVPTVGIAMGYIFSPDVRDSDMMGVWVDFSVWSPELCWLDREK